MKPLVILTLLFSLPAIGQFDKGFNGTEKYGTGNNWANGNPNATRGSRRKDKVRNGGKKTPKPTPSNDVYSMKQLVARAKSLYDLANNSYRAALATPPASLNQARVNQMYADYRRLERQEIGLARAYSNAWNRRQYNINMARRLKPETSPELSKTLQKETCSIEAYAHGLDRNQPPLMRVNAPRPTKTFNLPECAKVTKGDVVKYMTGKQSAVENGQKLVLGFIELIKMYGELINDVAKALKVDPPVKKFYRNWKELLEASAVNPSGNTDKLPVVDSSLKDSMRRAVQGCIMFSKLPENATTKRMRDDIMKMCSDYLKFMNNLDKTYGRVTKSTFSSKSTDRPTIEIVDVATSGSKPKFTYKNAGKFAARLNNVEFDVEDLNAQIKDIDEIKEDKDDYKEFKRLKAEMTKAVKAFHRGGPKGRGKRKIRSLQDGNNDTVYGAIQKVRYFHAPLKDAEAQKRRTDGFAYNYKKYYKAGKKLRLDVAKTGQRQRLARTNRVTNRSNNLPASSTRRTRVNSRARRINNNKKANTPPTKRKVVRKRPATKRKDLRADAKKPEAKTPEVKKTGAKPPAKTTNKADVVKDDSKKRTPTPPKKVKEEPKKKDANGVVRPVTKVPAKNLTSFEAPALKRRVSRAPASEKGYTLANLLDDMNASLKAEQKRANGFFPRIDKLKIAKMKKDKKKEEEKKENKEECHSCKVSNVQPVLFGHLMGLGSMYNMSAAILGQTNMQMAMITSGIMGMGMGFGAGMWTGGGMMFNPMGGAMMSMMGITAFPGMFSPYPMAGVGMMTTTMQNSGNTHIHYSNRDNSSTTTTTTNGTTSGPTSTIGPAYRGQRGVRL